MLLQPGGIDVWYIDESQGQGFAVVSAMAVPFLRFVGGSWSLVWEDHFAAARQFRRLLRRVHRVPIESELHAAKFLSGRGRYDGGTQQFSQAAAAGVYFWILRNLGFLQPECLITVVASPDSSLQGQSGIEACMIGLFQRMRRASVANGRNGFVFFDEGHGEYRKLYRRARVFLPTGSRFGGWSQGVSRNLPLDMFTKDANFKQSAHSFFIQYVDLVAYAALLLVRHERGALLPWQADGNLGAAYDAIPRAVLNLRASATDSRGIVRL